VAGGVVALALRGGWELNADLEVRAGFAVGFEGAVHAGASAIRRGQNARSRHDRSPFGDSSDGVGDAQDVVLEALVVKAHCVAVAMTKG
jgi:hypothetical protein